MPAQPGAAARPAAAARAHRDVQRPPGHRGYHEPVSFDGRRFLGRGAIDAKGPAVALLAGIRAARAAEPLVGTGTGVLVQAVSGEEGGAMGTFGTRVLVEAGHVGVLNVFCEPTGLRYLPRATAAATARLRVRGEDAVDDRPGDGHNATVLLGYLAQHLARELGTAAAPRERVCIAGIGTGPLHNRVYGRGELLLNVPYQDAGSGRRTEAAVESAVRSGLAAFRREFAGVPEFARTAADCAEVTGLDWLKRGLPTLDGAHPGLESLLRQAGIDRWLAHEPPSPATPSGRPACRTPSPSCSAPAASAPTGRTPRASSPTSTSWTASPRPSPGCSSPSPAAERHPGPRPDHHPTPGASP
ncbi:M20/M25/M40 family metallo-hydrolase [Kitasatospora arboriphila]